MRPYAIRSPWVRFILINYNFVAENKELPISPLLLPYCVVGKLKEFLPQGKVAYAKRYVTVCVEFKGNGGEMESE